MQTGAPRARLLVGDPLKTYIRQRATASGDDPNAVEAVGYAEGGFDASVGDHGTSFGPFQLHAGGELPGAVWQRGGTFARLWANSTAGIDYAIGRISTVARGLKGDAAVDAIVTGFEKPADGGTGDRQRAADYMHTHGRARAGGATSIKWLGASTAGVKQTLLDNVAGAVLEVGGYGVMVTSAKRAPGPSNDVKNSNHITGDALDGYVLFEDGRSVPLGTALKPVASRWGLRSGDAAGFDPAKPGGYDAVHVDDGANVGGVRGTTTEPSSPTRVRPGGDGGGVASWVGAAAGGPFTIAEKEFETLFGGGLGGLTDVFKGAIWLMNPKSWLRAVEFGTGTLLMLFGFIGLAVMFLQRSGTVGKAAAVASALPGPVGLAGKAVTTVRRPAAAARASQARKRTQAVAAERRQRAQGRLQDRRERDELDLHYNAKADELDPRRRARAEQRESREQERRERLDSARSRLPKAAAGSDDVPF